MQCCHILSIMSSESKTSNCASCLKCPEFGNLYLFDGQTLEINEKVGKTEFITDEAQT